VVKNKYGDVAIRHNSATDLIFGSDFGAMQRLIVDAGQQKIYKAELSARWRYECSNNRPSFYFHTMSYFGLGVSSWRVLGLTVGTGYTLFGIFEVFRPLTAVRLLMDTPPKPSRETESTISVLGPLLGARDLSIAASIFALHSMGRDREMDVVIVTGTILCYADAITIWLFKSPWL